MAQPSKHPTTGVYYTRRKVPRELREALGREYKVSLRTREPAEAKRLHVLELAKCDTLFARARSQLVGTTAVSVRDARVLAGQWFRQELAAVEASGQFDKWLASGTTITIERGDCWEEQDTGPITLEDALDGDRGPAMEDVQRHVKRALKAAKLPLPPLGTPAHEALLVAFTEYWFKLSEVALARYNGDWHATAAVLPPDQLSTPTPTPTTPRQGRHKLLEVFEEYAADRLLTDGATRAVLSTTSDYRALMREFAEVCGDLPVTDITPEVVRAYRATIAQTPPRGQGIRQLSVKAKIEKAKLEGLPTITPATINNKLRALSAVLSYAGGMQYLGDKQNPVIAGRFLKEAARAMRRGAPKGRNYYDDAELRKIFGSPIYTEGWEPPRATFGKAWYWLPMLLYYTGARLEEMAQLLVTDVKSEPAGHFLSILNTLGEEDSGRGVKNTGSRRNVPLHPDLINLGFNSYVASLPPTGQLFPGLSKDPKGYFGTNFGKRWAEYLRVTVGLQSPASPSHGFRHTFKTLCRDAGIHEDVHDAITGHAGGSSVARNYGAMPLSRMIKDIARFPSVRGPVKTN